LFRCLGHSQIIPQGLLNLAGFSSSYILNRTNDEDFLTQYPQNCCSIASLSQLPQAIIPFFKKHVFIRTEHNVPHSEHITNAFPKNDTIFPNIAILIQGTVRQLVSFCFLRVFVPIQYVFSVYGSNANLLWPNE